MWVNVTLRGKKALVHMEKNLKIENYFVYTVRTGIYFCSFVYTSFEDNWIFII